jgi:L-aspartate oxidase
MIDIMTASRSNLVSGKKQRAGIVMNTNVRQNSSLHKHCRGIICTAPCDSPLASFSFGETMDGQKLVEIEAVETILATGGIGGLFEHSTNYPHLTGDALAICLRHSIQLQNPDYIQIHPTTFYSDRPGRSFLISESVRGEGGILLDGRGERFTDELQPRDIVSQAILNQMEKENSKHVWLSMEKIPGDVIKTHFRHIYEHCLEEGYDCTREPIPVVPAQHYFMGGIKADLEGRTSMPRLFAVGETCCNGVHGRNRLASNSLLESLVWARHAALAIAEAFNGDAAFPGIAESNLNSADEYADTAKLEEMYKKSVLDEIERMKKYHEKHKPKQYITSVTRNHELAV